MTNKDKLAEQIKELSPEDIYNLLHYILLDYAMRYTDSRLAVIEWLKEEADEETHYGDICDNCVDKDSCDMAKSCDHNPPITACYAHKAEREE